jgi:hypothetical protein
MIRVFIARYYYTIRSLIDTAREKISEKVLSSTEGFVLLQTAIHDLSKKLNPEKEMCAL